MEYKGILYKGTGKIKDNIDLSSSGSQEAELIETSKQQRDYIINYDNLDYD